LPTLTVPLTGTGRGPTMVTGAEHGALAGALGP